jgi:hypothetical protein
MAEIKTLEEALKVIEALEAEKKDLIAKVKQAEDIANDAVNKVNEQSSAVPGQLVVSVDKKKYIVRFGVDGLKKAELAENPAKLKELIKKGSGAVVLKED